MPSQGTQGVAQDAEAHLADSTERLVASESFAELLARSVENIVALHRIATAVLDLLVRNLRLAGRQDVVRLGKQVGRTEDKLERVLQEVEMLQQAPAAPVSASGADATRRAALGGAAVASLVAAIALVVLHPPSIADLEEAVTLAVAGLALVLTGAWLALAVACRSPRGLE